jgi:hypothetical protein
LVVSRKRKKETTNSRSARVETTLGELIAVLYEETELLLRKNEKNILAAYILNDLLKNPRSRNHNGEKQSCLRERLDRNGKQ